MKIIKEVVVRFKDGYKVTFNATGELRSTETHLTIPYKNTTTSVNVSETHYITVINLRDS